LNDDESSDGSPPPLRLMEWEKKKLLRKSSLRYGTTNNFITIIRQTGSCEDGHHCLGDEGLLPFRLAGPATAGPATAGL